MTDRIETIGKGSIIQHGKLNDRIYLMKLVDADASTICESLSKLALKNNYTKIFCKVPKWIAPIFFADGYSLEAYIPKFYNAIGDVFFVSKFLNSDRLLSIETSKLAELSTLLNQGKLKNKEISSKFQIRKLNKADAIHIAEIYREVFLSYPFPIHKPEYILTTMDKNVQYFGAVKDGILAAISSSETDKQSLNTEMTDFATSPGFLGNNLSVLLLMAMEEEMKLQGFKTLYTIARLNSIPMNKTFLKLSYNYTGTLINNTNIAGNIESMNVFYKHI